MNKLFFFITIVLLTKTGLSQSEYVVPLEPTYWDHEEGSVDFIEYKGQKAIKMDQNSRDILLKDYSFKDGTIEFDVEVSQPGPFPTLYFRALNKNAEHVYLRTGSAGKANAYTTLQYASIIEDVNLWDLQHEYQTRATILMNEWNHVKLVVSGKQLRVYVNSEEPNLEVPAMEGNLDEGNIGLGTGFPGQVIFANLVIKPNETESLSPLPGPDITRHDTRYLRTWEVTTPIELKAGREVTLNDLPKEDLLWESIEAERRGLINLSRKYGLSESRRLVWLKTSLYADTPKTLELKLGFSDEVWVFVNGAPTYVDKNLFIQNMRKNPKGRISIDNSRFPINLMEGENTLMIAVANDFYGWGIMAKLEHLEGIEY